MFQDELYTILYTLNVFCTPTFLTLLLWFTYVRPLSVKKALSVKIIGPLSPKALKCKKI